MSVQSASLMEALAFNAEDLAANHEGHLSDAQKARLKRGWQRTLWIGVAFVIGILLLATVLLFQAQQNGSSILTLIGVVLTVINAVIVARGAQSYLRTSSDLNSGQVSALSGVVSHTIRVTGRVVVYVLKVEDQEMIVSKLVFRAVEDGKSYRFYRAPASKTLLAAEPE